MWRIICKQHANECLPPHTELVWSTHRCDAPVEVGEKNKIECKYCKKVVSGAYRLKCHLAHTCGDGRPCEEVPPSVKELMQRNVLERKRENVSREIGEPSHIPYEGHKKLKSSDQTGISAVPILPSSTEPISEEALLQQASISIERSGAQMGARIEEEILPLKHVKKSIGQFFYDGA